MMETRIWETEVGEVSDILDTMLNGDYDDCEQSFESLVCELSDNSVPIYNWGLYEDIQGIKEYADQVLQEMRFDSLDDVLRMAYYERTQEGLFDNFQNLCFNFTVQELNSQNKECEDDDVEKYFYDLESRYELSFNNSIPEIKELVKKFVGEIE